MENGRHLSNRVNATHRRLPLDEEGSHSFRIRLVQVDHRPSRISEMISVESFPPQRLCMMASYPGRSLRVRNGFSAFATGSGTIFATG